MTRDFDLRVSPRRLSVAGLYLRDHLRQRLQCRLVCSTSHSTLIASRLFLSCFPAMRSIASEFTIASIYPSATSSMHLRRQSMALRMSASGSALLHMRQTYLNAVAQYQYRSGGLSTMHLCADAASMARSHVT